MRESILKPILFIPGLKARVPFVPDLDPALGPSLGHDPVPNLDRVPDPLHRPPRRPRPQRRRRRSTRAAPGAPKVVRGVRQDLAPEARRAGPRVPRAVQAAPLLIARVLRARLRRAAQIRFQTRFQRLGIAPRQALALRPDPRYLVKMSRTTEWLKILFSLLSMLTVVENFWNVKNKLWHKK